MSAFDKVIGYDAIKMELEQICDMIKNKEVYEALGAKLPQGILLYGEPGLGKTLMAKCFIEESGLEAFTVRRTKSGANFVAEITDTFEKAKQSAPAIVFFDDMDKFANEDYGHCDAEEYVAIQAGIDDTKGTGVFVIATVNDERKLPRSLKRSGRFDRKYEVQCPNVYDSERIIASYLSDKKVSEDVNMDDLAKMFSYSSCAELESLLNDAAISAAYARKDFIEMTDLVKAVLRSEYDSPDNFSKKSEEDIRKTAMHEAGHLVISEAITPGSVGFASIKLTGRDSIGGYVHRCIELGNKREDILVSLGGKAAVELYYADTCASGCARDLDRASGLIRNSMSKNASFGFGMYDGTGRTIYSSSAGFDERSEAVVQAELERNMFRARDILLKNRTFLEAVTDELCKKEYLLHSDIQRIKEGLKVVEIAA